MSELHEHFDRHEDTKMSSDRNFCLTFAAASALIGGIKLWKAHHVGFIWLGGAAIFAVIAWGKPSLLHPLNKAWAKLGLLLFKFINPVVMALLYFTTIVPIGVLMRLCKKDPLRRKYDPKAASYWIARTPPGPTPESMKQQF